MNQTRKLGAVGNVLKALEWHEKKSRARKRNKQLKQMIAKTGEKKGEKYKDLKNKDIWKNQNTDINLTMSHWY